MHGGSISRAALSINSAGEIFFDDNRKTACNIRPFRAKISDTGDDWRYVDKTDILSTF